LRKPTTNISTMKKILTTLFVAGCMSSCATMPDGTFAHTTDTGQKIPATTAYGGAMLMGAANVLSVSAMHGFAGILAR